MDLYTRIEQGTLADLYTADERSHAPTLPSPPDSATRLSFVDPSDPVERQLPIWAGRYRLTPGELDVLMLTAHGMTQAQIASHRATTLSTVKTQGRNVCRKLRAPSLTHGALRLLRDVIEDSAYQGEEDA